MGKKVLLLNPPGSRNYVRDYYCSKISKADYVYHPVDLLVLSGWLHNYFDITVLDCIAEKINPPTALIAIGNLRPDAVVFLTGAVSKDEDFRFLERLKEKLGCLMVGIGDCLLEDHINTREEAPWIDAIVLDFTTDDLLKYLRNELLEEGNSYSNIIHFKANLPRYVNKRVKSTNADYPLPRYELFPNELYKYPFVKSLPFATVLAGYGCPYHCRFCVMPSIGYKHRSIENILNELDYIKSLKIKDIYFADQTFGCHKKFFRELCFHMIDRGFNFNWVAFTRVDLVSEDFLLLMKQSGAHTLMFGVECPVQHILDLHKKGIYIEQIEKTFRLCNKHGIKTVATFIIGLPGSTYEENIWILDFAKRLNPDYASFNIAVPRMGTEMLKDAVQNNWLVNDNGIMDQSGNFGVMKTETLSVDDILTLRRNIEKRFYFRPSYILKRIFRIRTLHDARLLLANGLSVMKNT